MTECRHVCISGTTTTRNVLYYKLSILSYDINVYQSNSKTKKEVIVLILLSKKLRFNEVI